MTLVDILSFAAAFIVSVVFVAVVTLLGPGSPYRERRRK